MARWKVVLIYDHEPRMIEAVAYRIGKFGEIEFSNDEFAQAASTIFAPGVWRSIEKEEIALSSPPV